METERALKDLFLEAVELPRAQRASFLQALERRDAVLKTRLEALLAAHDRAESAATALALEQNRSDASLRLPVRLGNYLLIDEIAAGGSGIVYRARQLDLSRTVAIKLLRAGRLASDSEVQRFRTEAEAAARLDHASIVPVFEVGFHEGRHFISMKLIDGPSLDQCMDRYHDDPRVAAELVAQLARAVDHGHRHGVLHRDIKPSNVLIDSTGAPYVADFGTAKFIDGAGGQTVTGWIIGTPNYMAPEQAAAKGKITTATDVYALGCVLYELLVGEPPLVADTLVESLRRIQESAPTAVRAKRPKVHRDLETICHRCLEKEPVRRYGSALALAEDLERWLAFRPIEARRPTVTDRMRLAWRRRPLVTSLFAAVLILFTALVIGATVAGFELAAGLKRTRTAEERALAQLRHAYCAEARTVRLGAEIGRRARALDLLGRAAAIRPGLDLVHEGIATLALTDLAIEHRAPREHGDDSSICFDAKLERYFICRRNGEMEVRQIEGDRSIFTLPGDGQPAWRSRFSPDGRYLALTHHSESGAPRFDVWDLELREIVLSIPAAPASFVDFAPDRPVIVACWQDGRVIERDLATGVERTIVALGVDHLPRILRYSPAGDLVGIVMQQEEPARIYGVDGGLVGTLSGSDDRFYCLGWSADGTRIAAGSADSNTYVWSVASQILDARLIGHSAEVVHVAFPHPDLLATHSWDNTTRLWDLRTGATIATTDDRLLDAPISAGRLGFAANEHIIVRSLVHDGVLRTLHGHEHKDPHSIDIDSTGRLLASCGENEVFLWDIHTGKRLAELREEGLQHLMFAPDGSLLIGTKTGLERRVITDGRFADNGTERLLDVSSRAIDCSSDGSVLVALSGNQIVVHHTSPSVPDLRFDVPLYSIDLSVSPDGQWVATGNYGGSGMQVWRTSDGALESQFAPSETYCKPQFSPDGRWLACGTRSDYRVHRVGTWDLAYLTSRGGAGVGNARATRFSPDSQLLLATLDRREVALLSVATGDVLAVLETSDRQGPNDARFTPDGKHLLLATELNRILVWNLTRLRAELAAAGLDAALSSGWSRSHE